MPQTCQRGVIQWHVAIPDPRTPKRSAPLLIMLEKTVSVQEDLWIAEVFIMRAPPANVYLN